jgi:D-alanyl-lipoteichoic acid acyltransferase DltB (MBOAT superfamily)
MIVFLISGFWHGANWNFIFWGALHGSLVNIQSALSKKRKPILRFNRWIARFFVFNLVLLCWIYFRSSNFAEANFIIKNIFTGITDISSLQNFFIQSGGAIRIGLWITIGVLFLCVDSIVTTFVKNSYGRYHFKYSFIMSAMIVCILLLGFWGKVNFIYFQF